MISVRATCDYPGCPAAVDLSPPRGGDLELALIAAGWRVGRGLAKHVCPAHAAAPEGGPPGP